MWYVIRCGTKIKYPRYMCLNEIGLHAQSMIAHSKLNSQHNWGGPIWLLDEHEYLHFDIEQDIHMSSFKCEESGYGLDLDSLTIWY